MNSVDKLLKRTDSLLGIREKRNELLNAWPASINADMLRMQYAAWFRDFQARIKEEERTRRKQPREKTWMDYFVPCLMEQSL
jgi:hypothetical protein